MILEPQEAGEHIRNGNMRVIAQVAEQRLTPFPNVPTVKEAGFDLPYYAVFRGIVGPPGMPRTRSPITRIISRGCTKTAAWKKYLEDNFFDDGFSEERASSRSSSTSSPNACAPMLERGGRQGPQMKETES